MAPTTLNQLYRLAVEQHAQPAMFRRRSEEGRWVDISTAEFASAVEETAHGLLSLGIESGDRVALVSPNRLEWMQADLATLAVGAQVVPIYPTLLTQQVEYILRDSAPTTVFCSDTEQMRKVESALGDGSSIRHVVCFEPVAHSDAMTLAKLRELGRVHQRDNPGAIGARSDDVDPDDPATIIYTSGTTGTPKGVVLTHRNIVKNVEYSLEILHVGPEDSCLSFLPLSHILERMAGYYLMLRQGVTINFAQSVETVAADLAEVSPTIMISVPRLYEKIYARVLDNANQGGPLKRRIFHWARRVGQEWTERKLSGRTVGPLLAVQQKLADRLVFTKLRARTGGRVRFFISGGAPLSKEIAEFFHAAGLIILEGYGLTETSPVIAVNTETRLRPGSVGPPIPNVEVRIAEDGEILTRSECVMQGYYRLPEETAEVVVDGWLHTGDIGHLDDDGFLHITDRKKAILVTAGGKNVAPQPVENALKLSRYVSETVLVGDKRRYLVALLVPDLENVRRYAEQHDVPTEDATSMIADPRIQELFSQVVHETNQELAQFEQIKYFRVVDHEFSLEDGQLTPSLKVRRSVVLERYAELIDEMYTE